MRGIVDAKKLILSGLFLVLAVFCSAPALAQESPVSESVKLNNLKISGAKKQAFMAAFVEPLLSSSGSAQFDEQSQTVLLKDSASRVDFIKKIAGVLDESGLRAKDFFVKTGSDKKRVTELLTPQVLVHWVGCDVGEEFSSYQRELKKKLLVKMVESIRIQFKWVDMGLAVGLELTGARKRVELTKRIVTLFDETDYLDKIGNI